jgi:2-phospho-L-lactate guanylyltransferase
LRGAVPDARHQDLALAMVRDTVSRVLACAEVTELLVVTDDPAAAGRGAALGARRCPTPGRRAERGLRFGADVVAGLPGAGPCWPATCRRCGRTSSARRCGPRRPQLRAGRGGTGTVLLTAPAGVALEPRFGVGSAAAHAASGARLTGAWPGCGSDVDTPADLAPCWRSGAGEHTCALLRDLGLTAAAAGAGPVAFGHAGHGRDLRPRRTRGTLLLDDGTELAFPAEAFRRSGLRLLRLGQRVDRRAGRTAPSHKVNIPESLS